MKLSIRMMVATAAFGVTAAALAGPAAADIDEDVVASRLCPGASWSDGDTADSGDEASVGLYVYERNTGGDSEPDEFCTFAIISTDDDSTLNGSYSLTVAGSTVGGPVSGNDVVTAPVVTAAGAATAASVTASGQQTTVTTQKATKKVKKAATKALAKATKKAKKKYVAAGRTAKAKKAMNKKIAAAKKKYRSAIAPKTITTKKSYRLDLAVPIDGIDP